MLISSSTIKCVLFSRTLQQIVSSIIDSDVHSPVLKVLALRGKGRRQKGTVYRSLYYDILFLSLAVLRRETINVGKSFCCFMFYAKRTLMFGKSFYCLMFYTKRTLMLVKSLSLNVLCQENVDVVSLCCLMFYNQRTLTLVVFLLRNVLCRENIDVGNSFCCLMFYGERSLTLVSLFVV